MGPQGPQLSWVDELGGAGADAAVAVAVEPATGAVYAAGTLGSGSPAAFGNTTLLASSLDGSAFVARARAPGGSQRSDIIHQGPINPPGPAHAHARARAAHRATSGAALAG